MPSGNESRKLCLEPASSSKFFVPVARKLLSLAQLSFSHAAVLCAEITVPFALMSLSQLIPTCNGLRH